jgi:V/A-type H+-transporting ATPase subunit E
MAEKTNAFSIAADEKGPVAFGVEKLIERLRSQGVDEGRRQADVIVEAARVEASQVIAEAQTQAARIIDIARDEAQRLERAGGEALTMAARDAILSMKNVLMQRFVRDVERLIAHELRDPTFLKQCILEVIARTRERIIDDPQERLEVILPEDIVGVEELRRKPEELEKGTLSQFMLTLTDDILREGVTFKAAGNDQSGIRVRLIDKHVDIDLSDRAIAGYLLQHLEPRFRAMLEGIVR